MVNPSKPGPWADYTAQLWEAVGISDKSRLLGIKEYAVYELTTIASAMAARDPVALSKLLLEDSHDSHEDIAFELGLIGDPCAVEAIAEAVRIPFDHLVKWNNLHEFQRVCAYALARIGTAEARAVLESLAAQSDPFLRKYGEEGLQHWPFTLKSKGD